ncbi:sigma-70 family RNA polymerase sigma factor [Streptomyces sp. ISL-100]|uniref:RNA polymerase sigma factor n=1 Tax=Streptomyces sp. ISL-100 TaxID=2819173 RepID=UPI0027E5B444|nr:sigma-70 family RNA polymerase sigma factor [Streptomyces sp. ISL-100]
MRSPRSWLRTVAWRCYLRQAVRVEAPDELVAERCDRARPDWRTPLEAAELSEQQRRVLGLLFRLPVRQRAVMAWHLDGFSTKEIAEAMGTREDAVRQNLVRARHTLREHLCPDTQSRGQS